MDIKKILQGSPKDIQVNIDLLAADYHEKTGRKLNKGCAACIWEMILTLKNMYKMTNFKFARHAAQYKNKKGDKTTISNSTMTDEKAIEFLRTNPERIKLFSEKPSNWKELIEGKQETEEEKEARIAAEAEMNAIEAERTEEVPEEVEEVEEKQDEQPKEESREDLMKMTLPQLRSKYPLVKATSKENFVNLALAK